MKEEGKAIPLVLFQKKKYIITPEAKSLLSHESFNQIALISVVGKYRTGKSFLMNNILIQEKRAFKIGNTQKACTKGIWIYSKPKVIQGTSIFFIDTEGLGAYDEEINHDTKIFLIAILISSIFIFNSHGTIDENSINTLDFIINLSKHIKVSQNNGKNSLEEYFPDFLWLLRDFSLRLVDKNNNSISTKEFLENALNLDTSEEKSRIRKSIKQNFKNRDCFTLVRPVENETDLQNLENLDPSQFRETFIQQCEELRRKIFYDIKPKTLNGKLLTGENLISFLENVVDSVNSGAVPVIENSWKYMLDNELQANMKKMIERFILSIKEIYLKELDSQGILPINSLSSNLFKGINIEFNNLNNKKEKEKEDEDDKEDSQTDSSIQKLSQSNIQNTTKISYKDLYNLLNTKKQALEKEIINEFLNSGSCVMTKDSEEYQNFEIKFKASCQVEYKKFMDLEVELLIQKGFNERIEEKLISPPNKNFYKFIQDLELFIEDLESFPQFKNKDQLITSKIIVIVRKFYEDIVVKEKSVMEGEIFTFKNENNNLNNKLQRIESELKEIENENKIKNNTFSTTIINLKGDLVGYKEQVRILEIEKNNLISTYTVKVNDLEKEQNEKLNNETRKKENLEEKLKEAEHSILNLKLQMEKKDCLEKQKNELTSREIEELKKKLNSYIKEKNILEEERDEYESEVSELKFKIKSLEEENEKLQDKDPSIISTSHSLLKLQKQNDYLKKQLESTKKTYQDIIQNLRSNLQEKNVEFLKETNSKKIIETNFSLSKALKSYEERCNKLEEKLTQHIEFKKICQNSSSFQCKECYKYFSLNLFTTHYTKCLQSNQFQQNKLSEILQEEKKIMITVSTVSQNELYIEVNHRLQIWKLCVTTSQLTELNNNLRNNFSEINFDFDFLQDNDVFELDEQLMVSKLNIYFKHMANFEKLNQSSILKEFVKFEDNYEYFEEEVDKETVLNNEILNNFENTLTMTMGGGGGFGMTGFRTKSISNMMNSTFFLLNNPLPHHSLSSISSNINLFNNKNNPNPVILKDMRDRSISLNQKTIGDSFFDESNLNLKDEISRDSSKINIFKRLEDQKIYDKDKNLELSKIEKKTSDFDFDNIEVADDKIQVDDNLNNDSLENEKINETKPYVKGTIRKSTSKENSTDFKSTIFGNLKDKEFTIPKLFDNNRQIGTNQSVGSTLEFANKALTKVLGTGTGNQSNREGNKDSKKFISKNSSSNLNDKIVGKDKLILKDILSKTPPKGTINKDEKRSSIVTLSNNKDFATSVKKDLKKMLNK